MTYAYESPLLPFRQTQWRVVVIASALFPTERVTAYEWRVTGKSLWRPQTEWPQWDGIQLDAGLPPVCAKLLAVHRADIAAVLAGQPLPVPAQPSLFA